MPLLRRFWPLILIAGAIAAAFATGLHHELSWSALAARQGELRNAVAVHPVATAATYVAVYVVVVAVSIPGSVWLSIAGGLLFGAVVGPILAVLGAGSGAVLLFLAARGALAPLMAARAEKLLARVRPGLERDGFSTLLALRLIPIVPFWLTNLAPALVGMRLAPYAAATFLGIIPGAIVFAGIGAGLGDVLGPGSRPDLSVIFSPAILLPLVGLAALSLLPVAWRRLRRVARA